MSDCQVVALLFTIPFMPLVELDHTIKREREIERERDLKYIKRPILTHMTSLQRLS